MYEDDDFEDEFEDDDFDWETLPYQDKWLSEGVPTQAYKEHLEQVLSMKVKDIKPYYILEVIYEEVEAIFKLKKKLNHIVKLSDKEIDDIVNEAIEEVNDENHIPEPIEPSLSDKTQNDVLIFLSKLDQDLSLSETDIRLIINKYLYTYIKL